MSSYLQTLHSCKTFQMATDVIIAIISIETLSDPSINGPNAQGHWNL